MWVDDSIKTIDRIALLDIITVFLINVIWTELLTHLLEQTLNKHQGFHDDIITITHGTGGNLIGFNLLISASLALTGLVLILLTTINI